MQLVVADDVDNVVDVIQLVYVGVGVIDVCTLPLGEDLRAVDNFYSLGGHNSLNVNVV